jgi:hypothetical protein
MYDTEILNKTKVLIQEKYLVSEESAIKYAKWALDALVSHGGSPNDFSSVIKVIEVVVKSWIDEEVGE